MGPYPLKSKMFVCRGCKRTFENFPSNDVCPSCSQKLYRDDYFLFLDIETQLNGILSKDNIKLISQQIRHQSGSIKDITRGMIAQKIESRLQGFEKLSDRPCSEPSKKQYLTLSLNTDGVSPFRSSNKTLWLIFLTLNELSLSEKFKIKNTVLAVIYCSVNKPDFDPFQIRVPLLL